MKKFILSLCLIFTAVLLSSSGAWAAMSDDDFVNLCCYGSPEEVADAIRGGANVNAIHRYGSTALSAAIMEGENPEVVKILLENGADASLTDEEGRTPLNDACYANNIPVITMLLDAGADINGSRWTPLMSAMGFPNLETITFLLDRGADISARNESGLTAFWFAATYGDYDEYANVAILQLMLDRGADINERDAEGRSVLTAALEYQPPEVIAFLRDNGATE